MELPSGMSEFPIPAPPQYQPQIEVRGGHKLAQLVNQMLKIAPALQGQVKSVQYGPTNDLVNAVTEYSSYTNPADHLESSPVLGVTKMNQGPKQISLNPNIDLPTSHFSPHEILAHELTHASGYPTEDKPWEAADVMRQLMGKAGRIGREGVITGEPAVVAATDAARTRKR